MKKITTKIAGFLGIPLPTNCEMEMPTKNIITETKTTITQPNLEEMIVSEDTINNCNHIYNKKYSISAEPIRAGQTTNLNVIGEKLTDTDPITKIVLYENGVEINSLEENFLSQKIINTEKSTKKYHAEIFTENGTIIKTEEIAVNFSGQKIDFIPIITDYFIKTKTAGKANRILVCGKDIGDNQGIKNIRLYEDGNLIDSTNESTLLTSREFHEPTKKTYFAEIEDKGGNIVKTETSEVSYSGEAFPPNMYFEFNINGPRKTGKFSMIMFEAKDDKNLDSMSGIKKATLYEDGQVLQKYELPKLKDRFTILKQLEKNEKGSHVYEAEFFNGNGLSVKSKPVTIEFSGEYNPPEERSNFYYDNDKKTYNIFVEGKGTNDPNRFTNNKEIKEIRIYEDGKLIKKVQDEWVSIKLGKPKGETHTYFAEITNIYDLTTTTDKFEIKYK